MITGIRTPTPLFAEARALTVDTSAALKAAREADGSRLYVVDGDVRLTIDALVQRVSSAQAQLRGAGVQRGDIVGVQLPNWWEAVVMAHAIWGMGAVLCPIPVNYRVAELTRVLAACRFGAVVVPARYRGVDHPALLRTAAARAGTGVPVVEVREAESLENAETAQSTDTFQVATDASGGDPELATDLDAVSVLMFTSGTTGTPKGVLHSHRTLLSDAWSIARLYRLDGDRIYMPSPVGHITGLVYGVMMPLLVGGAVVLQAEWEAAAGADLIEKEGCTFCVGATPFLRGLTDEYARRESPSSLLGFACGGADVPPALVRRANDVLDAVVARAYGLTEMPTVTCGGPDDPEYIRADTDGRLTGTSQARVADPVKGVGELEVRGPELCLGYLDADHTSAAFTTDGWFRTGDLGAVTADGAVTIVGRAKDIIVRGGENISVKEIEDLLLEHPGVGDAAVVGIPDEVLGERSCAVIVVADGGVAPTLRDLGSHLLTFEIAIHKLPEYLVLVEDLPRTESGKVQKYVLRELASQELAAGRGERR